MPAGSGDISTKGTPAVGLPNGKGLLMPPDEVTAWPVVVGL
jgi:hypothetical protein